MRKISAKDGFNIVELNTSNKGLNKLYNIILAESGHASSADFNKGEDAINVQSNSKFLLENFELLKRGNSASGIENGGSIELAGRALEGFLHRESTRQHNREKITAMAAEQLQSEQEVADEPVDPDWRSRFFRHVEDVSNEQMQMIWGKILAGEIKSPNSFSFRTMDVLRNLSQDEAKMFADISKYAVMIGGKSHILHKNSMQQFGFNFKKTSQLIDSGLISSLDTVLNLNVINGGQWIWLYGDLILRLENLPVNYSMATFSLTEAGNNLMNLMHVVPSMQYLDRVTSDLKSNGIGVSYSKSAPGATGDDRYHAVAEFVKF